MALLITGLVVVGLLVLAGLWMVVSPASAWRFSHFGIRWMYRDRAEPSDAGLTWTRTRGCYFLLIAIVLGLMMLAM